MQISTTRPNLLYNISQETRFSYYEPLKIYKLIMGLITNDWKHLLKTETSQKTLFKIFCYNNKVIRKVKDFQKVSNKEIYLSLNKIVLNTTNLSNPFHDQTSLRDTIFSDLTSGVKLFLIG